MKPIQVNQRKTNSIRRKSIGKKINMNFQSHHQETIIICPTIVITDANNLRGIAISKNLIKLCARLTAELPTTSYISKIIWFKLDENSLLGRIYFLTFLESLEMMFSQYEETCEVLLEYPKIGGENITEFAKKGIRNIFYAKINVHSMRSIDEFPGYGIKFIEKL